MGDMKTPDFGDLLAAFDIPDATGLDANEGVHVDREGHLKTSDLCLDASVLNPPPASTGAPAVSVIVKNTSRQNSCESASERDCPHLGQLLQNGFKGGFLDAHCPESKSTKSFAHVNGDCSEKLPVLRGREKVPTHPIPQFSPISSPESEDTQINGLDEGPKPSFLSTPLPPLLAFNHGKPPESNMAFQMNENLASESMDVAAEDIAGPEAKTSCIENGQKIPYVFPSLPGKTNFSRLSSCLDALAALNAKNTPGDQANPQDLLVTTREAGKIHPKLVASPTSPKSSLEVVKRSTKPPDSPMSLCSESSGKASPAIPTGSPPAIPRMRIKTIKTKSGEIKRTITSVLADSETEDFQSSFGSSPSQFSVEDAFSKTWSSMNSSSDVFCEDGKLETAKIAQLRSSQNRKPKQSMASPSQVSLPSTNHLPKALHLANLNLVPHGIAASVTVKTSTSRQDPSQLSSSAVWSSVPLVHQVKKPSPDARAVVPNSAAGTLNRLLNYSNPVPTYIPDLSPPPGCDIKLPPQGYCCLECGDAFGLKTSLAHHYSRRSVHIEVACTHCSKTLVFFNKCVLLAHAREHKSKGVVMQCTQLFMKPIAADQMLPASKLPAGNGTSDGSEWQGSDLIRKRGFKCQECKKKMSDGKALAWHYQRSSVDAEVLICKVCSMPLPNSCSYQAHQRIHTHTSPHCCPECGAIRRSADIQKHVKENCLHYARKAGYTCPHCEMLFLSLALLRSHGEEKHCRVFYKCPLCPVAFRSSDGCLTHVKNKHAGSQASPLVIYKCSCETVFKRKPLLYQHFQNRVCVFKCPDCSSFYPEKHLLVQHFKGVHGAIRSKAEKTSSSNKIPPRSTETSLETSLKNTESSCQASGRDAGRTCSQLARHMKTSHKKALKRHPCQQCELSFASPVALRRHVRKDHDSKQRVYPCWLCTHKRINFTTHAMLKSHITLMHGIKNPDFSQMKFASQERLKRTAEEVQEGTSEEEATFSSSAKRLMQLYRCAKCGFTSDGHAQFQDHIPQHKTHSDTPQCQRCGLCFTSPLALSRHLFIVHKLREPEEHQGFDKNSTKKPADGNKVLLKEEVRPSEVQTDSLFNISIDTRALETSGLEKETSEA